MHPLAAAYVRWTFLRAIFHRGWWLVTSLYLVVEANLSPLQLVSLGTAQGLTVILFEIPTGVVADNYSRKWSIVVAHVLMGIGMLTTGLVTSFPALMLTQMLWGLSWTFSSGADVAWLTDELDQPNETGRLLGVAARWGQIGAAVGLVFFGLLAWLNSLSTAIVLAGALMLVLGGYVAIRFTERRFVPSDRSAIRGFRTTLKSGLKFARSDQSIMLVLTVTFLVNGADEAFARLIPKGLIDLGLPIEPDPMLWLTTLGLVTLGIGAITLRLVENRLQGEASLRILYLAACLLGGTGILLFGFAPNHIIGMAGVIVVHGIAWNVARVVATIWINERAENQVRATLQSFLSQAENLGEVSIGFGLGVVAQMVNIPSAMLGSAIFAAAAAVLILRVRARS